MTTIEVAHDALTTLHERLTGLEDQLSALAAAALAFDVVEVKRLTDVVDAAQPAITDAYGHAATALNAARAAALAEDADLTDLVEVRHHIRVAALRLQEVQADTRQIVERARGFTGAHARALVGAPAAAVGYTRRAMAAMAPSMSGALQTARV